jgi:hypothetical protein
VTRVGGAQCAAVDGHSIRSRHRPVSRDALPPAAIAKGRSEPCSPPPLASHAHRARLPAHTDGKIHYMEDTHKANHHAAEEERICTELVRQQKVNFLL